MKKLTLLLALTMILFSCKPEAEKPTVVTKSVGEVTETTAKVVGQVTADGGAEVTERGVCWNTAPAPEVIDYRTKDAEGGLGIFTLNLSNLETQTTYFVRAYATNEKGVSYGEDLTFTTKKEIELPEVKTAEVEDITESEAVSGGEVVSDGGAEVTARGICWSTKQNPTIEDDKTADGIGVGNFTSNLSDLEPQTTYYVRAYATNEKGTAYGKEASFTTEEVEDPEQPEDPENPEQPEDPENPGQPEDPENPEQPVGPVVTTAEVTDITVSSAVSGGEVVSGGDAVVVARGVCWNTTGAPTVSDTYTMDGTNVGIFTSQISNLVPNTQYYVRAYATDAKGVTSYGEEVTFTTLEKHLPTVTTAREVTDITVSSAKCGGEVTFNGNVSVTARGICWSTTRNPTIEDNKTTDGTGVGIFTSNLSNLEHNTTYYVRAYATNEAGTAYGKEVNFTTLEEESLNGTENGHEYVDLGLPSGLKWATCNVGASSPEEYGDYFAWGETTTKSDYTSSNCPTYGLSISQLQTQGYIDNEGNLTAQYDAATANWGGDWRLPTKVELEELKNNCTWTWITQNGINGYNVEGPNGNSIFLPAAGYRYGSLLDYAGRNGYCWSSTPYESVSSSHAYSLGFISSYRNVDGFSRNIGHSVRSVLE